jgi:acetyltransferase-like isoleucine patch superfamily enzyme
VTVIDAEHVDVGAGCVLGRDVHIAARRVRLGPGTHIADGCRIRADTVDLGEHCVLFGGVTIHALRDVQLGAHAKISRDAILRGVVLRAGTEFWVNRHVEVGGGAWRSGDGGLIAGDRCHLGRNTHVNVARRVTLGDDTAIGMDCIVATHANWQPATRGYPVVRAPVTIGSDVAVYSRCTISPGVTIGSGATLTAGAVVLGDVPERALVGGVPARVIRIQDCPRMTPAVARDALAAFAEVPGRASADVRLDDAATVTLSVHEADDERPACVFDLDQRTLTGRRTDTSEALRQHLFAYGLRFRYVGYRRDPLDPGALVAAGIEE